MCMLDHRHPLRGCLSVRGECRTLQSVFTLRADHFKHLIFRRISFFDRVRFFCSSGRARVFSSLTEPELFWTEHRSNCFIIKARTIFLIFFLFSVF